MPLYDQTSSSGRTRFLGGCIPAFLFLFVFCVLLYTSYPSIGWWDSGEYAVGTTHLSIPMAGGSVLYVLLGRLFAMVFFFVSQIKAVTLVSISAVCVASVFLYFALLTVLNSFPSEKDASVKRAVSFLTALSLPFLYSVWLESHVARVYALGLLLSSIILFCIVKIWCSEDEEEQTRLFLLAAYLLGIDFAAHRMSAPFLPVMVILLLFPMRRYLSSLTFWVLTILFYVAGFSMHLYLLLRSQLYPPLHMDSVQTWGHLLSWIRMDILGASNNSPFLKRSAPFWGYQVNHMYLRYFAWNFLGTNVRGLLSLSLMPIILGAIGFMFSLLKRARVWVLLCLMFALFSVVLVFYLNVQDGFHRIREIDRLYLPSFLIFLVWVGIGLYGLSRWILRVLKPLVWEVALAVFVCIGLIVLPLNLITANWEACNKRAYHFPVDFAYNILSSCEENAVLFTNGDNDTFPLWYLQAVEGFRTDISVVNVNLLGARFYIDQVIGGKDPLSVELALLDSTELVPALLENPVEIVLAPPESLMAGFSISDTLKASFSGHRLGGRDLLLPQDQIILSFLRENRWERPVYFAMTVHSENLMGLEDYLSTVGIVRELLPVRGMEVLPEELERNLMEAYRFRSFDDPGVPLEGHVVSMYNNFRHAFVMLAEYYLSQGDREGALRVFEAMTAKLPEWRFSQEQNESVKAFAGRLRG